MDDSINNFLAFRRLWENAQRPMTEIVRWSNFPEYGQTLVEHSNSVPLVALWVTTRLSEVVKIDTLKVVTALMVHDHGEPLAGGDVLYYEKKSSDDLAEWVGFRAMVDDWRLSSFRKVVEDAFLLQFCRNTNVSIFDVKTQKRIQKLQQEYKLEAAVFDFVERIDYLLSASIGSKQGLRNSKETMMAGTLRNQTGKIEGLVKEFPEFKIIWTPELKSWLQEG